MDIFVEEMFIECEEASLAYDAFSKLTALADRAHKVRMYATPDRLFPGLASIYQEEEDNTKPSADAKVEEKKKGLLARAWDKIVAFFRKISDAIFGKKVEEIQKAESVEVPENIVKVVDENQKLLDAMKQKKKGAAIAAGSLVAIMAAGAFICTEVNKSKNALFHDNTKLSREERRNPNGVKTLTMTGSAAAKYYTHLKAIYATMAAEMETKFKDKANPLSADEKVEYWKKFDGLKSKIQTYEKMFTDQGIHLPSILNKDYTPDVGDSVMRSIFNNVGRAISQIPQMINIKKGGKP